METISDTNPPSPHLNLICNLADNTARNLSSPVAIKNQDLSNDTGGQNKRAEIAKLMFDGQAISMRKEEL
jgi:hypothetical protein